MFIPRRDHVFIEGDGKAAEARFVFVLAEDYEALAACDQKPALHAKTISRILNIDVNIITKTEPFVPKINVPYYELGKRIRHAGHNGMKAFRLAMYTHMDLNYCEFLMNRFHEDNPKIRSNFHNVIADIVRRTRVLKSPNGRVRTFFGKMDDHLLNEAYCQIQQGGVSDLTKFTMWRIKEELPNDYYRRYRFLTEQHDGILAEVHKDLKDRYIEVFKKHYERPIDFRNCSLSRDFELIIPAEISWSDTNWCEMKNV
jgi:DNA polymerase I-like protein with 3'-5' exonuclease and polymerase domains